MCTPIKTEEGLDVTFCAVCCQPHPPQEGEDKARSQQILSGFCRAVLKLGNEEGYPKLTGDFAICPNCIVLFNSASKCREGAVEAKTGATSQRSLGALREVQERVEGYYNEVKVVADLVERISFPGGATSSVRIVRERISKASQHLATLNSELARKLRTPRGDGGVGATLAKEDEAEHVLIEVIQIVSLEPTAADAGTSRATPVPTDGGMDDGIELIDLTSDDEEIGLSARNGSEMMPLDRQAIPTTTTANNHDEGPEEGDGTIGTETSFGTESCNEVEMVALLNELIGICDSQEEPTSGSAGAPTTGDPGQLLKKGRNFIGGKRYKCKDCSYSTNLIQNFRKHSKIHDKEQKEFACVLCPAGKSFFHTKLGLESHVAYVHHKKKLVDPVKQRRLRRHVEVVYNNVNEDLRFKCILCMSEFKQRAGVHQHIRTVHWKERYNCKLCFKPFWFNRDCLRHERTHEKPYECHHCGEAYHRQSQLRDHSITHSSFSVQYSRSVPGKAD